MEIFAGKGFDSLSFQDLLETIRTSLKRLHHGQPAYTLLIGAGFSAPLIPTTRGMVERDIAYWLFRREQQESAPFSYCPSMNEDLQKFAANLWRDIHKACGESFHLDDGGLPDLSDTENIGKAYQAIMNGVSIHGLSSPQLRRDYMRDVGRRAENKINGAHLYLASILQAQDDWSIGGPFCRTIFTTNFDSLLQRSLQLVGKLYYMSDYPGLLEAPEDDGEVVHLVYCHGSVHRRVLLNTHQEIGATREAKASYLVPYFQRHGIIVIGHSGWRDMIVEALLQCKTFDGNLYWCDIHPAVEAKSRLNEGVLTLLKERRGTAFYVPITSADNLMFAIHDALGLDNAPQLAMDPMRQMIRNLKSIDLSGATLGPAMESRVTDTLPKVIERTLQRLRAAKQTFDQPESLGRPASLSEEVAQVVELALTAKRMNDAFVAAASNNWNKAVLSWSCVIDDPGAMLEERIDALLNRGFSYLMHEKPDLAVRDFTSVLAMDGVSSSQRAKALVGRGMSFMDQGNSEQAVEDYTEAINIPDVPPDQKAKALLRRGHIYWLRRFSRRRSGEEMFLLEGVKGDNLEKAISDFTAIVNMVEISQDIRALALCNRGTCLEVNGRLGNALGDFAAVIDWPGVSAKWKAHALGSRGKLLYMKSEGGDLEALINDSLAALELDGSLSEVHLNLGLGLLLKGDVKLASEEYWQALDLPERCYREAITNIQKEKARERIEESDEVESILEFLQNLLDKVSSQSGLVLTS